MKTSLTLQTQTTLSQRVQQAIALLPMSTVELQAYIQDQLDENPFLVAHEPATSSYEPGSSIDYISKTIPNQTNLPEELIKQLYIHTTHKQSREIGKWIIYNLDEHGFFKTPASEVAKKFSAPLEHVEDILLTIQKFEPTGIATQGIAHYWKLLLREEGKLTAEVEEFLGCIEKLATHSLAKIAQMIGYSLSRCQSILDTLRKLPPYPVTPSTEPTLQTTIPDVITHKDENGTWMAELNEHALPSLLVNNVYLQDIRQQARSQEAKTFITERVGQARWLLQSLKERAANLLRVSECLVRNQQDYWLGGGEYLRPMTIKTIAESTGLHNSTVSRITTNKYIQTPYGVLPFKFFFTRSLTAIASDSYENEGLSNKTIQYLLKNFINDENHDAPLSDDTIVSLFETKGVLVARRTINKYRKILNIPSSFERKRLYELNPQSRF